MRDYGPSAAFIIEGQAGANALVIAFFVSLSNTG
jgi:hypothetical protein